MLQPTGYKKWLIENVLLGVHSIESYLHLGKQGISVENSRNRSDNKISTVAGSLMSMIHAK